jgi:[1-hydroxy-2-(trimethylamino)ethyl]phosphonate dioxygenase
MTDILAAIDRLFAARGADEYHGEAVTQLEHALQAALLAEQAGASGELVAAALVHDIGHLLHEHGETAVGRGIDDRHEALGEQFLRPHFGPSVTQPILLHVPAKRFLCATDPAYRTTLSGASQQSLELQGGPMLPAEASEFARGPNAAAAVALRRWDDAAKVVGLAAPPLAHFRRYLEAARLSVLVPSAL